MLRVEPKKKKKKVSQVKGMRVNIPSKDTKMPQQPSSGEMAQEQSRNDKELEKYELCWLDKERLYHERPCMPSLGVWTLF